MSREVNWAGIFRFFGLLTLGFVLIVGGAIYWAATHPGSAWKLLIQPRIFASNTQVRATAATFRVNKVSWRLWKLEWVVTGLQIDRPAPQLKISANLKLVGEIRLINPNTEFHIESAEFVTDAPLVYEVPPGSKKPQSPFQVASEYRELAARSARFISLDKLKVAIGELQMPEGKAPSTIKLKIAVNKPGIKDPLETELNVEATSADLTATAYAGVRLDLLNTGTLMKADLTAKSKSWESHANVELSAPPGQFSAKIKGDTKAGAITGGLDGLVQMTHSQIYMQAQSDVSHLPGPVPEIKGTQWTIEQPLADNQWFGTQAGHISAQGPVSLFFVQKELREQLESGCKCKFPDKLNATLEGSLWPGHIFDHSEMELPVTNIKIAFDPINNSLMELHVAGQFTVVNDRQNQLQYWPIVETTAKFLNFSSVKGLLEANKIIVPSPFDILSGTIEVKSKATLAPNEKGVIVIPGEIKIALSSPTQKVNMGVSLSASIPQSRKYVDLYANFSIDDFIVELPPVDPIHGVPKITADPRLVSAPAAAGAGDDFKVRFIYDVRTSKPGAIRLMSKMAKPAIPVSVDVDRTKSGDTRGIVKTEPFELNYMHRTLFIDGLRLILDDRETADFAVDGRLRMEQSQYKVNIIVSGTIRSPLIKLTSEPELGRSDIISVILYDRTSDQLVAADRETVGVFDTAVADRAIGLLGLWVFASTPIRSFHYNPATKVYTATVQLAEGTTGSVGTDWEDAAQVEVRKRVTKQWVLTASWKPATDEKSQSGKLVLQWEKRF